MTGNSTTSLDFGDDPRCVSVLLPLPLGKAYTYAVPDGLALMEGDFVAVPLGVREVSGVVWDGDIDDVPPEKLKAVLAKLDAPPMTESAQRFAEWVANYNMASLGSVLKMFMSVPDALKPPKPVTAYSVNNDLPEIKMTKAREQVLGVLKDNPPLPATLLAKEAGVGTSVIKGLAKLDALIAVELPPPAAFKIPNWQVSGPKLSLEQASAAASLRAHVEAGEFYVSVLEGVPGSGKTEVYLEAVCAALAQGKQALVLLPEIALGAQWLARFKARFGCEPTEWHSDLTQTTRRKTWRAVATGEAKVIVGARSALFLPYTDLGVIIVDEEHDQSFKQEDGVIYNARDMAVVRAQLGDIPISLVSATPSLESLRNVECGRYEHFDLLDRYAGAELPEILIIDMRQDKPATGKWLSPNLIQGLKDTFAAGEQALLFLNRRGYAPLTLCQGCGHRFQCPQCTAWLVEHRFLGRLQCHHCGYQMKPPDKCPSCDQADKLYACGPGVERLAEEVQELFPDIRAEIAVSDNLHTPTQAQELVSQIENREIDLIIGTQIVAKGYHFPYLTLVGVVDADVGLTGGDIRALERTYQLLYQVAGRAGRAEHPGKVLVQTHDPENSVMQALKAGDHKGFIATMSQDRERNSMPPFGRLAGVILSSSDERAVDQAAANLARTAPRDNGVMTLGPAPAPLALLRGRHRRRFLVKAGRDVNIQTRIRAWLKATELPRKVRLQLDIDPYSFM